MNMKLNCFYIFATMALLMPLRGKELTRNGMVHLLEKHCYKCHDNDVQKGEFNLEEIISDKNIAKNIKQWKLINELITKREMPPAGKKKTKQFSEAEIISLSESIDQSLKSIDWSKLKHAGHVTVPFLSQKEYLNSIRDLLYWDHGFSEQMGPEIIGLNGFSTDRDNVSIRESQISKYLNISERILTDYFRAGVEQNELHFEAEKMNTDMESNPKFGQLLGLDLNTIHQTVNIEHSGFYEISVKAWAYRTQKNKINQLNLKIDNKKIGHFRVLATEGQPANYKLVLKLKKGPRLFQFNRVLVKATRKEFDLQLPNLNKFKKKIYHGFDPLNSVAVDYYKIKGPLKSLPNGRTLGSLPQFNEDREFKTKFATDSRRIYGVLYAKVQADKKFNEIYQRELIKMYKELGYDDYQILTNDKSHATIMGQKFGRAKPNPEEKLPAEYTGVVWGHTTEKVKFTKQADLKKVLYIKSGNDKTSQIKSAGKILRRFAIRAFRRSVSKEEMSVYYKLCFDKINKGDSYYSALKDAMQAILCSPKFLVRLEDYNSKKDEKLSDFELAARMSTFLWQSIPDMQLLTLAAKKKLQSPEVLKSEIRRMLKSPKAQSFYSTFPREWLGYYKLGRSVKLDPKVFPEFKESLIKSMEKECELFFRELVQSNLSLYNLLDSNFSYINKDLAKLYGIKGFTGTKFKKVKFNNSQRGGILGMAAVLTASSSKPTRTSLVNRGNWVLTTVLGVTLPEPPANVGELSEDAGSKKAELTLRQELEKHRNKASCASCHSKIDPLGFALENYDSLGRWRQTIGGKNIDSTAVMPNGVHFKNIAEFKKILLSRKRDFTETLTEQLLTFALGRKLEYYDTPVIEQITKRAMKNNGQMQRIIEDIILSYPFRYKNPSKELNHE